MKHMKKIVSLMLAAVMVLGMTMTASADEGKFTITPPDEDHTYEVYQIFTGDLAENDAGDKVLSNVRWGQNGTGTEGEAVPEDILEEIAAANGSDTAKLEVIEKYVTLSGPYATITDGSALTNVPAGYYLIRDAEGSVTGDDAYTTYIVQVVGDIAFQRKATKPTPDKKVADKDGNFVENADHAINESFQFQLLANVPADEDLKAYESYVLNFVDTMSAGITFENIASVKVKVGEAEAVEIAADAYQVTEPSTENGNTLRIDIADLKPIVGADNWGNADVVVEVIYNAHLNENAIVANTSGDGGNSNMVHLEYSNDPKSDGKGESKDEEVGVFTFEIDNDKVDATDPDNQTPLEGAGFRLYTDESCQTEVELIWDDGMGAYRPLKDGETRKEGDNGEMFSKVPAGGTKAVFNIKGLAQGTYYLKETTTPAGYNTCEVVTIKIDATITPSTDGTAPTVTLTQDSTMSNTIENKQGTVLPSTGGIGTTLFYIIGGVLVLGALVLLVTKKRMGRE